MVVADNGYDTRNFVAEFRHMQMTPQVAQTLHEMEGPFDAVRPGTQSVKRSVSGSKVVLDG
jgi:hypothetical protein